MPLLIRLDAVWVTFEFLLINVRYVSYYELICHTITPDSLGSLYIYNCRLLEDHSSAKTCWLK